MSDVRLFTNNYSRFLMCQQPPKNLVIQNFSIPENIIYYIYKNATMSVNAKLFHICKYFLKNQRFDVFENISTSRTPSTTKAKTIVFLRDVSSKIWVTGEIFCIHSFNKSLEKNPVIFQKLCYVNVKKLSLLYQKISYNQFYLMVLNGKVEKFWFCRGEIKYSNGSWVNLAEILEKLPLIQEFTYFIDKAWFCSIEAAKKMIKLPILSNLKTFDIAIIIPEEFSSSEEYKKFKKDHSFAKFTEYKQRR